MLLLSTFASRLFSLLQRIAIAVSSKLKKHPLCLVQQALSPFLDHGMTSCCDRVSFLGLEGLHVLVTGCAGGIGIEVVEQFLSAMTLPYSLLIGRVLIDTDEGCKVSGVDLRRIDVLKVWPRLKHRDRLHTIEADISSEPSIASAVETAMNQFGPINILIANAGVSDELDSIPIWDMPLKTWDRINDINYRGTFLTVKQFLAAAKQTQESSGKQLENLAIVVTGSECGKYGQEGHVNYAAGKAALQYGLVPTVKNEIVRINAKGRINAVAPGWVNTPLIDGRLDDAEEAWAETQATYVLL